ncbi:NAD-dependent epimerase/dehydratase family protein [Salimicrobium halophilum]|uniref:Nucleoside-diphosphate-sugar epimerase n=1 Tax=Salimicrobium halophilum TaxID=86666 RepID=A0A1G8SAT4_9BACI|nr:NAD-dependent epimerase/dehydratase family protein [Salimicrobium halophilum]SDJ25760.1 Nucleoside-diphosphate-sugar epimerase [Salimicrobium halophilum]
MKTIEELERFMTEPSEALLRDLGQTEGDIMILGVGGKMGPTLAKMAKRAVNQLGDDRKVIGVSRFSSVEKKEELERHGVETIACDLMDEASIDHLPFAANIIYMAGNKFGTTGNEPFTWAMNAYVPGRIADKFRDANIVAFSTGNVYPLTKVASNGCSEEHPVGPVGEYAQSCLGRERILEHFCHVNGTNMLLFRLNYAIDLRYGVLLEIAKQVYEGKPVDVTMGSVNVIWQGDANEYALRSLLHTDNPARVLNVTGPETLSVRWLAHQFAKEFGTTAIIASEEAEESLLNNAAKAHRLFGYPRVSAQDMIQMIAEWMKQGGKVSDKPTHFQEREGAF